MLGVAHHQLYPVGVGGVDHGIALLQTERHRLLHQHVLAGVAGIHRQPVVQLMPQGDGDGVHLGVLQQLRMGRVPLRDPPFIHEFRAFVGE